MSRREAISGSIAGTLLRQLLAAGAQLASVVLVVRMLGVSGNGLYATAMLLPGLLTTFLTLGLPAASVYFLAGGDVGRAALLGALRSAGIRIVVGGLLCGALFVALAAGSFFPGVPRALLALALLYFPAALAAALLLGVLQAEGRFRLYNLLSLGGPLLTLALLGGAALLQVHTPFAVVALVAASQWCITFISWRVLREEGESAAPAAPAGLVRRLLDYGLRAHAANVVAYFNYRADMYFIAALAGSTAMGLYAVAVQFSERLFIVSQAVSTVLLPTLAGMQDDAAGRTRLAAFAARWSLVGTLLAGGLLYLLLVPLADLLFDAHYAALPTVLGILFAGAAVTGHSRVLANALAAQGAPGRNAWAGIGGALANILLCTLLVPASGIVGAALASLAGFVVQWLVIAVSWCRLNPAGAGELLRFDRDLGQLRVLYARVRTGRSSPSPDDRT